MFEDFEEGFQWGRLVKSRYVEIIDPWLEGRMEVPWFDDTVFGKVLCRILVSSVTIPPPPRPQTDVSDQHGKYNSLSIIAT